jgi:hypothetical protein
VDSKYRDGALAILAGGGLIGVTTIFKAEFNINTGLTATFFTLWPAIIGLCGMIAIELICLYNPELTKAIWNRRSVQFGSLMTVVIAGGLTLLSGIQWIIATLLWGLLGYLLLLIVVIVLGTNPLSQLSFSQD